MRCFGMERQESLEQLNWLKKQGTVIAAYDDTRPIGYSALVPGILKIEEPFVRTILPAHIKNTGYLMRLACLPEYRGAGIAKTLAELRLKSAQEQGYKGVIGHIRHGPALAIARKTIPNIHIEIPMESYSRDAVPHSYVSGEL